MICPNCGSKETRVYDTKMRDGVYWRWKFCKSCTTSFTTHERCVKFAGQNKGMVEVEHPFAEANG